MALFQSLRTTKVHLNDAGLIFRAGPEVVAYRARKSIKKHANKAIQSRQSSSLYVVLKPKESFNLKQRGQK